MQSIEKQQSSQWIWSLTTVHPLRNEVEQFIQGGYWHYFNASEISFLPELTSLWVNGQLKAAAGYCYAAQRTLFLEHYLNKPIESLLALRWQQDIVREDILEIGNLFASFSGGLRTLVIFFLRLCQAQQTPYVVFTATKQLAGSFQRLGVPLYALGKASAAALGDQQQHWGRYYEHQPQVVALRVSDVAVVLPKLQQGLRFAQDVEIL
ncbi:thermostable hemolysin [Zooshikella harenae]|uniref:Thermostable hemolysin n=1 Tax=Zooshikella harenae TaxID=2827238 RepID=A0ABS5ZHM5_9GAMM|nr:thermostable hemolysin [Zooshikella harenae]MBU2713561.1 thermostable hemolysin [Zooshikella harenae]